MSGYRTVTVEVTVKLTMKVDEGTEIQEVIDEMDYSFDDTTGNANIEDSEVTGHEVTDSR
jgi:hypothetical protein